MTKRAARLLQIVGVVIALIGLAGYWLSKDVPRDEISQVTRAVLNVPEQIEPISVVLAGRDNNSVRLALDNRRVNGKCVLDRAGEFVPSPRTDTMIFITIIGNDISMINLPRDLYLPELNTKLNAVRAYTGAEGLKDAVSDILGVPIDYYAIVNIDIFERLVDAIGGVEVTVPYPMQYQDCAEGLEIDFEPGPTHMDGEDASNFVRFRNTALGDIDRIDNVKRMGYAILARLKELNVRAVATLPRLIDTYFDEVETNATPALIRELLPRLGQLQIKRSASLPTCCERRVIIQGESAAVFGYDPNQVTEFLAEQFGGTAPEITALPTAPILLTDRSGVPGLAERVKERLVAMGFEEDALFTRTSEAEPGASRIEATPAQIGDARSYAELFGVSLQGVARLGDSGDIDAEIELVLTEEAKRFGIAGAAQEDHLVSDGR